MQSYVLKLTPGQVRPYPLTADLFVYESGVTTPANGDTRIKIKPDTGAEMVLRPGQRFRLAPGEKATTWQVSAYDSAVSLDGVIIIGSGEFDDANTLNKFTLDASFANNVKVTNDAANAVPVYAPGAGLPVYVPSGSLPVTLQNAQIEIVNDVGNRIPVSLDPSQSFGVTAPIMAYTNYVNISGAQGASAIVAPAANLNGIIVEQIIIDSGSCNLLAKASAPATLTDGDLLAKSLSTAAPYVTRHRIAAGKGLYLYNPNAGAAPCYALLTFL